jgi:hypothetical protein
LFSDVAECKKTSGLKGLTKSNDKASNFLKSETASGFLQTVFVDLHQFYVTTKSRFVLFFMKKRKNAFDVFHKIDAARARNVVESSEMSHFVKNWLLYCSALLKTKSFGELLVLKSQRSGFLGNQNPRVLEKSFSKQKERSHR